MTTAPSFAAGLFFPVWTRSYCGVDEYQTRRLERLKFLAAHANQLAQATQSFEHAALKALFIINGGAAIGLLAFVGTEASHKLSIQLAIIALAIWALGLFCASGASWLMYFSQLDFYRSAAQHLQATVERDEENEDQAKEHDKNSNSWAGSAETHRRHANLLGAASLILFLLGGFFTVISFGDALKNQTGF